MHSKRLRLGFLLLLALAPLAVAGDDKPAKPAVATADDVAKFLNGWAAAEGKETDAATGYPKRVKRTADNAVMVLIPAGTFQMGAVPGDTRAEPFEEPRHAVTLSTAYYLDETELTLRYENAIAAYERRQREETPWLSAR